MSSISDVTWAQSESACSVRATGPDVVSKIWFRRRVDRHFCNRVTQVQLYTNSRDQGNADDILAGSWTWFELVILKDETSTEPKSKDGHELVWRSHSNRLANAEDPTRHFGAVFDRRSDLLVSIEEGDFLGVRVCARFDVWTNNAHSGAITARAINEDLFTPYRWTLSSERIPTLPAQVKDGCYNIVSSTGCFVKSEDNELVSKIWFTTPALDQRTIDRFESIQLFTSSRLQKSQETAVPQGESFSWFDLVVLETPSDPTPRIENGVSLVWKSHANDSSVIDPTHYFNGRLYDTQITEEHVEKSAELRDLRELAIRLKGVLKPGNAIGVRVNAQYPGWENYARAGSLVVRISNEGIKTDPTVLPDVTESSDGSAEMQKAIEAFYGKLGFTSATTATLSNETRADLILAPPPAYKEVEKRPLRLLSLDGGGVRGVSPLRILKRIMEKVAILENKPGIKPCEYFDMIAGTSTGGLIAIMLGRLEMTIEECEKAYDEISVKVFGHKGWWIKTPAKAYITGTYVYNPEPLEDAIKSIVKGILKSPNALMMDPKNKNPRCKVLVMSALTSKLDDGNAAVHLRNYKASVTTPAEGSGWKIWEVARATSAAPFYFPRFVKDKYEYADGGLGWNNPSFELYCELPAVYGPHWRVECFLSLGTGTPPEIQLRKGPTSVEDFVAIATNSEQTHLQLKRSAITFPQQDVEKYWRFNLNKKMCDEVWAEMVLKKYQVHHLKYEDIMVAMDDHGAIRFIRELTERWLEHGKYGGTPISDLVNTCAARIAMKEPKPLA